MNELALNLIEEAKEKKLTSLDLGNCGLKELPKELFELTWLEELILGDSWWDFDISDRKYSQNYGFKNRLTKIDPRISELYNIKTLRLDGNKRGFDGLIDIKNLGELSSLQELSLENTKVKDFDLLRNLSNLEILGLKGCQITDASFFGGCSGLKKLNLGENKIEDFSFLRSFKKLEELYLNDCGITDAGFLRSFTNLKNLSLAANRINDISFLENFKKLELLYLHNCNISNINPIKTLTNIKKLSLIGIQVKDFSFLENFTNLEELYLYNCGIKDTNFLKGHVNFKVLSLGKNQIRDISFLRSFKNLEILYLDDCEITNVKFLRGHTNLKKLSLGGNKIKDFSFLRSFKKLEELYLFNSQIQNGDFLKDLRELKILQLGENKLDTFNFIANFEKLNKLYLYDCEIIDANFLKSLTRLKVLYLGKNKIKDFSFLTNLSKLEELNLYNCGVTDCNFVNNLNEIEELFLAKNKIHNLNFLKKLNNLKGLNLSENRITELPNWITQFNLQITYDHDSSKGKMNLDGNPIINPPLEIVKQGESAIKNYFEQLGDQKDYLFEAKLLLVGEERAGKSTIAKALSENNFKIDKNNQSTHGIDILKWNISKTKTLANKDFQFNVWDFGGQEIYHATHQFFLTKRSLYLFITEARKDLRFDDFYYWLNIINTLAGDSPVILVQNKTDQDHKNPSIAEYKELFPQIKFGLQRISCNSEHPDWNNIYKPTLDILKENIYKILKEKKLGGIGDELPKAWVDIREEIKKIQNQDINHIKQSEYFRICEDKGLNEEQSLFLSDYFHDLGVFLHFREDLYLRNTIFINHEWVTKAVYNVLDNKKIKENRGRFTSKDLLHIWKEPEFADMQPELINLLKNPQFKICYEQERNVFLAPQLFDDKPIKFKWRTEEDNLFVKYEYKFMPKGILSQLIVVMHKFIYGKVYWRSGVLFEYKDTFAMVKEIRFGQKLISIQIEGKAKRELLTIIRYHLEEINSSYTNLKIAELFGCNCMECKGGMNPYFFHGMKIIKAIRKGKKTLECGESFEDIELRTLLGDFIPKEEFKVKDKSREHPGMDYGIHEIDRLLSNTEGLKLGQELILKEQRKMNVEVTELKDLFKHFSIEQSEAIRQIQLDLDLIDDKILSTEWESDLLADKINELIATIDNLDLSPKEKLETKNTLNDTDISVKSKLKFVIPLFFLKYEAELELGNKQKLPKTWKDWKRLLFGIKDTDNKI